MKRPVVLAVLALVIVLSAAVLRPRLLPHPTPLAPAPDGVTVIAVEGLEPYSMHLRQDAPHFRAVEETGAIGIVPTRNGTPRDDDFAAGLRTILTGSRTPAPDETTLPNAVKAAGRSYTLQTFTGPDAIRDLDAYLAQATDSVNPTDETLVIVGVTPSVEALRYRERAAPIVIWQRDIQPSLLTSPSTRNRPGLCAMTDVAATVAALLDLPKDKQNIGDGRPIETLPRKANADFDLWKQTIVWGRQAQEQKLLPAIPWVLAGFVLLLAFTKDHVSDVARTLACAIPLSLLCSPANFLSVVTSRSPAWQTYAYAGFFLTTLAVVAALNKPLATRLPRYLAIATALIVSGDTLLGGSILSRAPLSYSVLEAARFYGIGNEVSGVFLGSALVAVGGEYGVVATLIWGLAAAIVSGAPVFGADAGGFIANMIAFSTLALAQKRSSLPDKTILRNVIAMTVIVGILTAAFAIWDGSRPLESRTHVGQLVASVQEHGFVAAQTIVTRKLAVNARLLVTSPWAILLAAEVVTFMILRRQQKQEGTRTASPPAQTALTVATVTLFALNDSGVVAGATCGLWLLALRNDSPP